MKLIKIDVARVDGNSDATAEGLRRMQKYVSSVDKIDKQIVRLREGLSSIYAQLVNHGDVRDLSKRDIAIANRISKAVDNLQEAGNALTDFKFMAKNG